MSKQLSESPAPLFCLEGVEGSDGHCPRCKAQLLWAPKRFNLGVLIFYESCPKCLPSVMQGMSSEEAIKHIETLQRDLENLTIVSRDIRRIQTELQFMKMDIEESQGIPELDTSTYSTLVGKAAKTLEENVELLLESSSPSEPPTVVERVKFLCADLKTVIEHVEQQHEENVSDSPFMFALCDILKQLELVHDTVEQNISFWGQDTLDEFRDTLTQLESELEHAQLVMTDVPTLSRLSSDVITLIDYYSSLLHPKGSSTRVESERSLLRKQMEEMERIHAQQIAALQSQLNAVMHDTVATTDVVAVEASSVPLVSPDRIEAEQHVHALPSTVVEAEVIVGPSHLSRPQSIMTVVAEPVSPSNSASSNRQQAVSPLAVAPLSAAHLRHATRHSERETIRQIERTDDLYLILNAMKEHPGNVHIQDMACKKLSSLTFNKNDNVVTAVRAGGIYLLLKAMKRYPSEKQLQVHCLHVICNFTTKIQANKSKISNAGGIDLVLSALQTFPKVAKVQIHGMRAIGNLTNRGESNTASIGNRGGIELVLKAMGQFPQEAHVQSDGLYAVCNLAFENEQNQDRIGTPYGILLLLDAMRHFPANANIQMNGLAALGNLSSTNAKNREAIGDLAGTGLVLQAMRQFPSAARIQNGACKTVAYLAQSPQLRGEMRTMGAISLVAKAKEVLGGDKQSVRQAFRELECQYGAVSC